MADDAHGKALKKIEEPQHCLRYRAGFFTGKC